MRGKVYGNLYQSVNFKFLNGGAHEPRAGGTHNTWFERRPVQRGRWLVRVGLKRSMGIVWQQLRRRSVAKREDGEGKYRRELTAGPCVFVGAVLGRLHGPILLHKCVRTIYRALARYRLRMNVKLLFLRRVSSSTGKLMAVAAAEEDKENISLAPCSADGSSSGSFNNTGAVSNSSCPWTKPIGSFPSEAAHERVVSLCMYASITIHVTIPVFATCSACKWIPLQYCAVPLNIVPCAHRPCSSQRKISAQRVLKEGVHWWLTARHQCRFACTCTAMHSCAS